MAQAAERYTKDLYSSRGAGQRPVLTTCSDEDEQTGLDQTQHAETAYVD